MLSQHSRSSCELWLCHAVIQVLANRPLWDIHSVVTCICVVTFSYEL